jgi:hypothetical protein
MSLEIRRRVAILTLLASLSLVPAAADAAQPRAGYYAGEGVFFKIAQLGERPQLFRISLSQTLTCADGTMRQDPFDRILLLGPKVSRTGRFRYEGPGITFKGRFTTRTQASGTLQRAQGDCTAALSWTAARRTAGEPLP